MPALAQPRACGGARLRGAHGVAVVLDHVEDRQLPQCRHVEALVDLALVHGAVAHVGDADAAVLPVFVGEGEAGAEWHLTGHDAVPAIEALGAGEHVHGAALALRVARAAPGQLGHDPARIHVADEHVAVVAIAGDDAVAWLERMLDADRHRLLTDIEVTEAADQAHAVELARLLLEAADQQHLTVIAEQLARPSARLLRLRTVEPHEATSWLPCANSSLPCGPPWRCAPCAGRLFGCLHGDVARP